MEDYNLVDEQLESLKEEYLKTIRVNYKLSPLWRDWCRSTKKLLMEHELLNKVEQEEF